MHKVALIYHIWILVSADTESNRTVAFAQGSEACGAHPGQLKPCWVWLHELYSFHLVKKQTCLLDKKWPFYAVLEKKKKNHAQTFSFLKTCEEFCSLGFSFPWGTWDVHFKRACRNEIEMNRDFFKAWYPFLFILFLFFVSFQSSYLMRSSRLDLSPKSNL